MHQVIGFHIAAADEEKLNTFYKEALGWQVSPGPHEHVYILDTNTPGIEGSTIGRGDKIPDYVSLCVSTDDVDASIEQCVKCGGSIVRPKFTLPNGDDLGIITDPEGHLITFVKKSN